MSSHKLLTSSVGVNHEPRADDRFYDEPRGDGRARPSERAMLGFLADRISTAVALIVSVLREIFDESAYTRFLSRHQWVVSRESYAAFLREQEFIKSRRHRCC